MSNRLDWPEGTVIDTEDEITEVNWKALLVGGHIAEYDAEEHGGYNS